jgi:hypothetical protein
MKNKQILLANVPFIICVVIIGIVSLLDLIDVRMTAILMFICLGCQQFFIGFRFYNADKKSRIERVLVGVGCFAFVLLMYLKPHQ